jgi:hypothetical protein
MYTTVAFMSLTPSDRDVICSNAAVLAIGAGTLADIFEPSERGTMLGIYYAAPLLGELTALAAL